MFAPSISTHPYQRRKCKKIENETTLLIKQAAAVLQRSRESANKISYDTNVAIQALELEYINTISRFGVIRFIVILTVSIGGLVIFVVIFRQIGAIIKERERAQQELEEHREQLEDLVKERTKQLETTNVNLKEEVDEREKAEAATLHAYYELDQIFNTAVEGLCVINKNFEIVRINQTLIDMLELPSDKLQFAKCHEIFDSELCNTPQCPMTRMQNGERNLIREVDKKCGDGRNISCVLTAKPFIDSNDNIAGIIESYKDITERKQAEIDILNAKEQAEKARRESEKINEQLQDSTQKAQLLADKATLSNRTKSEFLANMSHEIRHPHERHYRLCQCPGPGKS